MKQMNGSRERRIIDKQERLGWVEAHATLKNIVEPPRLGVSYPCPCCGFNTLAERGGFDICPVCFWEDDRQDDHDADAVRGGPNYTLSLTKARANFRAFGACQRKHIANVRPPLPKEQP